MKVAVTGAAGFLGRNLVNDLVDQGNEVVAIDQKRSEHVRSDGVAWVMGDVLDQASMTRALEGAQLLYHLAAVITLAQEHDKAWTINTEGVRNVAEAARTVGVQRMVHCGSVHAFDQYRCGGNLNESTVRSTAPEIPVYDRSKWFGEVELRKVIDTGLDAVICNPTGVYGPVDYELSSRLNLGFRDAARGRVPAMLTGGFDLVDVRDVALGLIAASDKGRTGENYLLGGGFITMLDACRMAAKEAGRRGPLFALPLRAMNLIVPIAEPIGKLFGSDMISKAAMGALEASPIVHSTKARTELGYNPRPASESMHDLIAFFVASGLIRSTRR
jgi:nucleoside-diphosphate-sugar epimerase